MNFDAAAEWAILIGGSVALGFWQHSAAFGVAAVAFSVLAVRVVRGL